MFDTKYGIHAKQLILNNNLMREIVKIYNQTPHHAFDYMFSPLEVQEHPEVEAMFIRDNMNKLEEVKEKQETVGYFNYQPGDKLLIHIPRWSMFEKRRRFFNCLATFIKYVNGNVLCMIDIKDDIDKLKGKSKKITIPIYFTKKIDEDSDEISKYFDNNKN
jgi:hypothetical protein